MEKKKSECIIFSVDYFSIWLDNYLAFGVRPKLQVTIYLETKNVIIIYHILHTLHDFTLCMMVHLHLYHLFSLTFSYQHGIILR